MKPGDLVIWTERVDRWQIRDRWGKILEISSAGVLKVKFFDLPDEPKVFKLRKGGGGYKNVRLATTDEIAARRWRISRPKTAHVSISQMSSYSQSWYVGLSDEISRHEADPVKLREAAAEMIAIAEWLEKAPK